MPPLLTRIKMGPNSFATSPMDSLIESWLARSIETGNASPPVARISAARDSSCSRLRAARATRIPASDKAIAQARPMPRLAPVIRAVLLFIKLYLVYNRSVCECPKVGEYLRRFRGLQHALR